LAGEFFGGLFGGCTQVSEAWNEWHYGTLRMF